MSAQRDTAEHNTPPEPSMPGISGIVSQLEDLVKLALECEKKELKPNVSFVDINKKLSELKNAVEILHQAYLETLKSFSMTEDDVKKLRMNVDNLKNPEKAMLLKLNSLTEVCEKARERLHTSLQENREQIRDIEAEQFDKSKKAHRKGKFKGVGGKKGWMPT